MSSKGLRLGTIKLVESAEKLSLLVKATTDVRVVDTNQPLAQATLESGNVWVSRGAACHFEIEVLFNGKPLDKSSRFRVLESVGYRIRDAKLWSLLSLSTALETPAEDLECQSRLSVMISQSPALSSPLTAPKLRPWLFHDSGLTPPPSVVSAKLEKVQIQFNFTSIGDNPQQTAKRNKMTHGRLESLEIPLSDPGLEITRGTYLDPFEAAVGSFRGLSNSMSKCFETDIQKHLTSPQIFESKRGRVFSKQIINVLKNWLMSNIDKEQASEADKLELMKQTGLQKGQMSRALKYHRKSIIRSQILNGDEMLFASTIPQPSTMSDNGETLLSDKNLATNFLSALSDEEMLLTADFGESSGQGLPDGAPDDDDDMLFSQPSTITLSPPPLTRTPSAIAPAKLISPLDNPLKRAIPINTDGADQAHTLSNHPASRLIDVALHTLLGGHIHGQQSMSKGVILGKPLPKSSLSVIAPAMFSPGFHKSMVQNSRFLPVISRSISASVLHNAQSPALKEKLVKLIELTPSTASLHNHSASTHTEGERLSSTLQSRLWAMMQKTLFDPSTVRYLWRSPSKEHFKSGIEEFTDLLWQDRDTPHGEVRDVISDNEFDDLFDDNDDGFMEYLEGSDMEGLEIERENEKMLFGDMTFEEVSDDELLLIGSEEDRLLL